MTEGIAQALEAWREMIGAEHVLTDPATLSSTESVTFATSSRGPRAG